MPRYTKDVNPPTLTVDRDYDHKEDWFLAEKRFGDLSEEYRTECDDKDDIDLVYDGDRIAARKYTYEGAARINFFEGYIPDGFNKSISNA